MRRLRIAINALTDLTPCYGSRVYLLGLVRSLTQVANIEVILLVGRGRAATLPQDLREYAVEAAVPAHRSYWQLPFAWRIQKHLAWLNADIWHLPNTLPVVTTNCATVVTIHDLADLKVHKYGSIRSYYRKVVNDVAARRADHVLTVSENSKRDLVALLGVPGNKITVVYPGVGENFHPLDADTCRDYIATQYGLPRNFILAPGGLARNKNVPGLLRAFSAFCCRNASHALVCTGHAAPREHQELASSIRRLGVVDRVFLTGHIPAEDLAKLYCASAAVAYLSLYEGFGLPVLEAMACGIPVVASERSSIPEATGDAGLQVNPEDPMGAAQALERVLTDVELRRTLIGRGLQRARNFSWHRTAKETLAVYSRVITQRQSSSFSGCSSTPQDEVIHSFSQRRI